MLDSHDAKLLSRRNLLALGSAALGMATAGMPFEAAAALLPSNSKSRSVVADRAFLDEAFGTHVLGGGVGNTMFHERHAHRFRAEATGKVETVGFFMRFDKPDHHKVGHYSIGDGGRIRIELQGDDDGKPSGEVLGATDEVVDPVKRRTSWLRLDFQEKPRIEQGKVYHIVYRQLDRKRGHVSVNDLHTYFPQRTIKSAWQPQQAHASLGYDIKSRRWYDRADRIPIYELGMENGVWFGQGMMFGGRFETGKVGADDQVLQTFRASDRARTFRRLRVAMHKLPGTSDDLFLDILRANGRTEATFRIPAKEITTSKGDLESEKDKPWRWVEVDLEDDVRLPQHDTLGIRFRARRGGYRVMTMQNGAQSKLEIRENKLGNLGCACHSTDGGQSFTKGWQSKFNPDVKMRMDLQMPLLLLTA